MQRFTGMAWLIGVVAAAAIAAGGCAHRVAAPAASGPEPGPVAQAAPGRGQGPPEHAPAHGYRNKARGGRDVQLRYDSDLGVYVAVHLEDVFFLDGVYYRYRDGAWQVTAELGDEWSRTPPGKVPPGLRRRY